MNNGPTPAEPVALDGFPQSTIVRVGEELAAWLTPNGTSAQVSGWSRGEWRIAAWLAYWQGAIPWLLSRADEDRVLIDPTVRSRLDRVNRLMRARTERLLEEGATILRVFAAQGIQALPLKGIVLADRYYPDPLTRAMRDIDLLIHKADETKATTALSKLGYRAFGRQSKSTLLVQGEKLAESWSPDHLRPVDLHTRSVDDIAFLGLDLDALLWDRSTRVELLGVPDVPVLRPAVLMFHVALHASNNWVRRDPMLSHLRDLEILSSRLDQADWGELAELSDRGSARNIFPALAFLARYVPAAIPIEVFHSMEKQTPPRLRTWIDNNGYGQLTRTSYDTAKAGDRTFAVVVARSRLVSGWREWARFLAGVAFPDPEGIIASHPLADSRLWPVAYLQRRIQRVWQVALGAARARLSRRDRRR